MAEIPLQTQRLKNSDTMSKPESIYKWKIGVIGGIAMAVKATNQLNEAKRLRMYEIVRQGRFPVHGMSQLLKIALKSFCGISE